MKESTTQRSYDRPAKCCALVEWSRLRASSRSTSTEWRALWQRGWRDEASSLGAKARGLEGVG